MGQETLYREGACWPAAEARAPAGAEDLPYCGLPRPVGYENSVWWFDNLAHGVNIEKLRKAPGRGAHLTESRSATKYQCADGPVSEGQCIDDHRHTASEYAGARFTGWEKLGEMGARNVPAGT